MDKQNLAAGLQQVVFQTADGTEYVAWGAVEASGDPQTDAIEIKGDDKKLGEFVTNQSEDLSLKFSAISFDVLQAITGNSVTSNASNIEIGVGTDSEQNAPYVGIKAISMARNKNGSAGYFSKNWHKSQIKTIKIGQATEAGVEVELSGTAYKTDEDIQGNSLTSQRVATIRHWV